jgi:hypothetical protein
MSLIQLKTDQAWDLYARNVINKLIQLINGLSGGEVTEVTLTPSTTTTVITDLVIKAGSQILLSPLTANAAAALGTTYQSAAVDGSATLTHANNAQADRTFRYSVTRLS